LAQAPARKAARANDCLSISRPASLQSAPEGPHATWLTSIISLMDRQTRADFGEFIYRPQVRWKHRSRLHRNCLSVRIKNYPRFEILNADQQITAESNRLHCSCRHVAEYFHLSLAFSIATFGHLMKSSNCSRRLIFPVLVYKSLHF